jgi:hypothetical protein
MTSDLTLAVMVFVNRLAIARGSLKELMENKGSVNFLGVARAIEGFWLTGESMVVSRCSKNLLLEF